MKLNSGSGFELLASWLQFGCLAFSGNYQRYRYGSKLTLRTNVEKEGPDK